MAIKNTGLGGTDWTSGQALVFTDLNDTFNATHSGKRPVISITENMIQNTKLSADASVTDIDRNNALVDVFTDSGGYNNTLNTGSTTSTYDSDNDYYTCNNNIGTPENVPRVTSNTGTLTTWTITLTISAVGYISKIVSKGTGTSGTGTTIKIKNSAGTVIAQKQLDNSGSDVDYVFGIDDYSELLSVGTAYIEIITHGDYVYQETGQNLTGTNLSYTSQRVLSEQTASNWLTYTPAHFTDSVVVTDSSTFAFNLASCLVNAETSTPTNTAITVDVSSDGGSTYDVTGQSLRTILELDDDDTDLVCKFNLTTTDDTVTPTISSFGTQLF